MVIVYYDPYDTGDPCAKAFATRDEALTAVKDLVQDPAMRYNPMDVVKVFDFDATDPQFNHWAENILTWQQVDAWAKGVDDGTD